MEKFNSQKHAQLLKNLPFSYFSLSLYLDCLAYLLSKNGREMIVVQDLLYLNEFPALFLPKNKNDWQFMSVTIGTEKDIEKLKKENIEILLQKPICDEFYYDTELFLKANSHTGQRIRQFEKNYKYKILNSYSPEKIEKFYYFWKKQKNHKDITFGEGEELFFFCLKNLKKYNIKQVYVEVDRKLVGLAWGVEHPSGGWVGLHLKVDYNIKGLSRFLHQERAKLFKDKKIFSLGPGTGEKGIEQYKKELGPVEIKQYYYILTGKKAINN